MVSVVTCLRSSLPVFGIPIEDDRRIVNVLALPILVG